MAHIVEVNGERRLQLSAEEFTRPMAWRNAWSKIRIGVTMGFNGFQSFAEYYGGLGVCVGQNGYNSLSTVAYFGFQHNRSFTYMQAGPYYQSTDGNAYRVKKIGSTITAQAVSNNTPLVAAAPRNLSQFFVEITKVGNVYSEICRFPSTANIINTVSAYDFLRNLENENGTLWNCGASGSSSSDTIGDQYHFDTVSVLHNNTIPTMEIANLEVIRFE